MNVEVYYYTRTGNTEKLAGAIAEELGVSAKEIGLPLEKKADILFLGSAPYAGKVDSAIRGFIEENADKIGVIAVFGSSASGLSTYTKIKEFAEEKGVRVFGKFYNCPGSFLFVHKGRPNDSDLAGAASFARLVYDAEKQS